MPKAITYQFQVILCGRKGEPDREIVTTGRCMTVNHRGDLLFHEKAPLDYRDPPATCCFRTGSWRSACRIEATA